MKISIGYSDSEDRLWLRTQRSRLLWWITRRVALRLVARWSEMIERDPWAGTASAPRPPQDPGKMQQVHRRAVAATRTEGIAPVERPAPGVTLENCLLASVQLSVRPQGMSITLKAAAREESWLMSPDECHGMLDALLARCRRSGWLEAALPEWLTGEPADETPPAAAGGGEDPAVGA